MTVLKKAIIKSYDAATHKATVQIAGSLGVWLDGVRVATDIPAADVQAGRQCTVLFLDPSNQDDAVVITIQGALPSGGGDGSTTFIGLTDTPGAYTGHGLKELRVNAAANAVEFTDQYAAAHTWAALQTFNAGVKLAASQQIKDSGGTGRFLPATTSPHATLTGDTHVSGGHLGVGWTPQAKSTLALALPAATLSSGVYSTIQFQNAVTTVTGNSVWLTGLSAIPVVMINAGVTGTVLNALDFLTGVGGQGDTISISGVKSGLRLFAYYGTITDWQSVDCPALIVTLGDPTLTTAHGVRIRNQGNACVGTAIGLKIEPQTGAGTNYLMVAERSAGNPSFRLDAGDPAANVSQLLIAVNNGAVVLRRVAIGAADSAGAGYRTLRVLN